MGMVNLKMAGVKSYRSDTYSSVIGTMQGKTLEINTHDVEIIKDVGKDSMIHHVGTEVETLIDNGEHTIVTNSAKGYRDGKMYMTFEGDAKKQKIWSEISAKDYAEHIDDLSDSAFPDEKEAITKKLTKNDDGKLILTYKDFPAETVREFANQINGTLAMLDSDAVLVNMDITYTVSDDFYPEKIVVDMVLFSHSNDENLPEFTVTTEYSEINEAVSPDPINFGDFTQVEDIRVLNNFNASYKGYQSSLGGKFKISGTQKITKDYERIDGGGYVYNVSFEQDDGKCEYSITTKQDGCEYTLKYVDGKEKTTVKLPNGDTEPVTTTAKTQAEAFGTLRSLMSPINFSENDVINMEIDSQNSDNITFYLDIGAEEAYEVIAEQYNGVLRSVICTVEVKYKDGELYKVDTTIEANIDASENSSRVAIVITEAYKQTFEHQTEEKE